MGEPAPGLPPFITGGGGQGAYALIQTPDRRPGWAYDFVRQGYTVYMMDYPGQGRAAYYPGLDGDLIPRRSGPLMEEVWTGGRSASSEWSIKQHRLEHRVQKFADWPQAKKYTEWPSDAPNKGKMGDPVFDYFAKTELQTVTDPNVEKATTDALAQLLDMINQPVVLVLNSAAAPSGWELADARPKLVKGIVAVEPWGPPIEQTARGATGPARLWSVANLPMHYDPQSTIHPSCTPFGRQRRTDRASSPAGFSRNPSTSLLISKRSPFLTSPARQAITALTPIAPLSGLTKRV